MQFDLPQITLILTAGVAALFSPCGYPMLPGYITYYLGLQDAISGRRLFMGGLACSLGLITISALIGIAFAIMGSLIYPYIPHLALIAGILVIGMGIILLFNISLTLPHIPISAPKLKGIIGLYCYGILYGLATISCTFPIFLSIIFLAISTGGVFQGIAVFLVYAVGMTIPLIATTILLYKAKDYALQKLKAFARWSRIFGGIVLLIIGLYLIYYYGIALY